jgi:hypothetical protein
VCVALQHAPLRRSSQLALAAARTRGRGGHGGAAALALQLRGRGRDARLQRLVLGQHCRGALRQRREALRQRRARRGRSRRGRSHIGGVRLCGSARGLMLAAALHRRRRQRSRVIHCTAKGLQLMLQRCAVLRGGGGGGTGRVDACCGVGRSGVRRGGAALQRNARSARLVARACDFVLAARCLARARMEQLLQLRGAALGGGGRFQCAGCGGIGALRLLPPLLRRAHCCSGAALSVLALCCLPRGARLSGGRARRGSRHVVPQLAQLRRVCRLRRARRSDRCGVSCGNRKKRMNSSQ